MKIFKKIGIGILAACIAIGTTGCGNGGNGGNSGGGGNGGGTLVITVSEQGYGVKWLNGIVDAYKKKTGSDVKVVKKIGGAGQTSIETEISSLSNKTDIFITEKEDYFKSVRAGAVTVNGVKYDSYYENLNDVYNAELEGENGATIKSKMDKDYLEYNDVDGNYYSLPWQNGVIGIVLNLDVWNKLGYTASDIPRTTEEMFEICDEIVAKSKTDASLKNVAPFIYSAESEYYSSFLHMWMAQYEGEKSFEYFINGKDPDGEVSEYVYTFDGQKKALQVIDRLLDKTSGYQHGNSDELSFTDMQSYFLSDQAAFCVNGSWLDIEMENYKDKAMEFIPAPVISDITEKFDDSSDKTDAKLREVIDFVDEHKNKGDNTGKPSGVTDGDVEIVREARQMKYKRGNCGQVFVPSFSTKIEQAKKFLKFMYSDEGLNIYYDTMNGATLPLSLSTGSYADKSGMSVFRKNIKAVIEEGCCVNILLAEKARIYSVGGVSVNFNNGSLGLAPYYLRNKEYTVQQIIDKNQAYVSDNWQKIKNTL